MAKAISMARTFDLIGYKPHAVQRQIHAARAKARMRVVSAGRRTGKSTSGGHELVPAAFEAYAMQTRLSRYGRRKEYWIVGPEYSDGEKEFRVLYDDLTKLEVPFDRPGTYNDPISGNMHLSLWDGRFQVHVKSAKYPDTLVGERLDGVILAEAAKLKPSIWPKFIRPMLADYAREGSWALMTSTPEGRNWFYEAWMNQQKGVEGWWSLRMPSWSNDILFPDGRSDPEIKAMEAELTSEAFAQEIGAEFSEFVGRVFKNFDEEIHCRPLTFNPNWVTYGACDYGWTNPFVWLLIQVDPWDNVYVLGEFYQSHMKIDTEIPDELVRRGLVPPNLRTFYPDPAAPGESRILEDALKIRAAGGTGGELKDRLRLIRTHLDINPEVLHLPEGHPERVPRLFIDAAKCPMLVSEMNAYRYPENRRDVNENELPMKKDDHAPEALGRFFAGYFGPKQRSRRSRVGRSTLAA